MAALRRLLERAAALPDEGQLRINRHDLDLLEELHDLSRLQREAEQWREGLGAVLPADLSEEPLDEGVHATLRPYQLEGYQWLSARWDVGLGGILADDMGLGKTLQLLAAIRRHRRRDERPVLVAAPRSVLSTWAQQSEMFTPDLRIRVITQRLPGAVADEEPADVYVVSHHLLRLDEDVYSGVDWAAVVLDEAQAAKNPLSRLHRTVRHLRREVTFAITGTPVENSLQDLWALLALTAPGLLPSLAEFNATWRKPIEKAGDAQLLEELRTRIAPSMLRRTKELVATDLPEKSEDVLTQPLHPQAADHYSRVLNRERLRILGLLADPDRNRVEILACLTRLRLLATDPGTVEEPSAKTAELVERLRETSATGHRALVFSQFTGHLKIVQAILEGAGISTSYLDGTTRDRERVLEEFRHGDQDAFLISLKAGGSGITLTEVDYVFLLDPWWNPAVEEQAVDRTHRIGQTSPVSVYRFVASGTIEEKVLTLQDEKRRLARSVLQADGTAPALLDPARIRELLEP
ncbi:DEAD/DEAH box helicase [Brachybacterium sp. GCM10030267]|uniref:DEAD/DEAH box helicase n=1 Tax=Brachybacterium sp. GCM10030267 TaxID=3273381 RepID=UPI0036244354